MSGSPTLTAAEEGMRNLPGRQQGDQARLKMDFQHVKLASLL